MITQRRYAWFRANLARSRTVPKRAAANRRERAYTLPRLELLLLVLLFTLPAELDAQFNFTTNNGTLTITGYTGSNGIVTLPGVTNGMPVRSIGSFAFNRQYILTGE